MPPKKTKGIILKRKDIGESDRLVTIYTYDLGKVEARATGARKIQSKLASHLEPFFCVNLMIAHGKRFDRIASARIIVPYAKIRQDSNLINSGASLLRLVDELTKTKHRDVFIYNLLKKSLAFLNDNKIDPIFLVHLFALKLLSHLGYQPEVRVCLQCHKKLAAGNHLFSLNKGGVICASCGRGQKSLIPLNKQSITLLRLMLDKKLDYLARLRFNKTQGQETFRVLKQFIDWQMEKSSPI
ncbi:MAG: DNA repair protein RecO [Patescibacteria group bacterium]